MKFLFTSIILLFLISNIAFSQNVDIPKAEKTKKGTFYMYWGWNRGWYTDSDIHFKGDSYDFTLYDVVAKDRQSKFAWDPYFKISRLTIPQYNLRIGYFFKENYSISCGVDHMKYVMVQNQLAGISGDIDTSYSAKYGGHYDNDGIFVKNDFLLFEHTDGLNYLNFEIRRHDELYKLGKVSLNITEGIGAGMLMPKTNATFIGHQRNDAFHVAGFGIGAVAGLNLTFWQYFFIQSEFKVGYINMPDIRITQYKADKASQSFFFSQLNVLFGVKYKFQ
jgi:hypothetical protein